MSINALEQVDSSQPAVKPDLTLSEIIKIVQPIMELSSSLPKNSPRELASLVEYMTNIADETIYKCQFKLALEIQEAVVRYTLISDSKLAKDMIHSTVDLLSELEREEC